MLFEKIPEDTFETLPMGAGVLLDKFTPEPEKNASNFLSTDILGATSGGTNFSVVHEFMDMGEGIDNCPLNMAELKHIKTTDVKMSGSFTTITPKLATLLAAAADMAGNKVTPRKDIKITDFKDIWLVCDYGVNGMIAIHLMNALSTGGFSIQTVDKDKGKFSFEFTGHFKMDAQDKVPYEIWIAKGSLPASEVNA